MNLLNGAFNPQQVRAIEKYVAGFVADVLKSYEAGPIEAYKAEVKVPKAEKASVKDV